MDHRRGPTASESASDLTPIDGNAVLQNDYVYDGAGRRTSESSGANMPGTSTPEVTRYWYDLRGNVIRRRSPGVHNGSGLYETTYEYDLLENKTRETNANGHSLQWGRVRFSVCEAYHDEEESVCQARRSRKRLT